MPRELLPCGTNAAYHRHVANGDTACLACLEAHADYKRSLLVGSYVRGPYSREAPKCGTRRGYRRHLRRGEPTCADCCRAERDYRRELTARHAKQAAA